ncbi:MAG: TonB-system energizer ExbB [Desulfobulbus sp.]|jgi:biopolymer transport protein ExbB|nr:TonB-system energizer ExbB [Desulfobulbus sp.]
MEYLHLIIDYGVLGLLFVLSLIACAVAIERWFVYRATRVADFADRRELELHLTNKLHFIATIGTNAPYIGLLGTVLGIMLTFATIGETGFDTARIMRGLSMALKATALGLLVAIPAVTLYNLLLRRCKVLLLQWDIQRGREGV